MQQKHKIRIKLKEKRNQKETQKKPQIKPNWVAVALLLPATLPFGSSDDNTLRMSHTWREKQRIEKIPIYVRRKTVERDMERHNEKGSQG